MVDQYVTVSFEEYCKRPRDPRGQKVDGRCSSPVPKQSDCHFHGHQGPKQHRHAVRIAEVEAKVAVIVAFADVIEAYPEGSVALPDGVSVELDGFI